MSYAKTIPVDRNRTPIQAAPAPFKALVQFYRDSSATSSIQTLTDNTTQIEVSASGSPAILRWIPSTETAAAPAGSVLTTNFDHVIPKDGYRTFVVPREGASSSSVVGINRQLGLYQRVAVATIGGGSVLTTEY